MEHKADVSNLYKEEADIMVSKVRTYRDYGFKVSNGHVYLIIRD